MSRGVHVLHVVRTLSPEGGMERAMRRVVESLVARGIQHSILLLSDAENVLDFGALAPVYRVVSPRRDPRMALGIWSLLRELNPTVIHVRNLGPWTDTSLARLFQWPPRPLVWSFHGVDSTAALSPLHRTVFRIAGALSSRLFAVSRAAKSMLVELTGIPERRVEVILNGVDTKLYTPPTERRKNGRLVVGTCGRLEPVKNHALLIGAASALAREGVEIEVHLAGMGSLEPMLKKQAEELGVAERVHFRGHVDDVVAFLGELDAFALTSISEGNPNALLEAMSTGLPCVATAVGAVREILQEGRSGVVVPPGDVSAFARALKMLAADVELRGRLGGNARERVVRDYNMARMLDAYEQLYRRPASRMGTP